MFNRTSFSFYISLLKIKICKYSKDARKCLYSLSERKIAKIPLLKKIAWLPPLSYTVNKPNRLRLSRIYKVKENQNNRRN